MKSSSNCSLLHAWRRARDEVDFSQKRELGISNIESKIPAEGRDKEFRISK
jgi:hypothetical protein